MGNIFRQYSKRFKESNWSKVSTLMVEVNGEYVEMQKNKIHLGHDTYIDEAGIDSFGRDWNDLEKFKTNDKYGKTRL